MMVLKCSPKATICTAAFKFGGHYKSSGIYELRSIIKKDSQPVNTDMVNWYNIMTSSGKIVQDTLKFQLALFIFLHTLY